MKQNAKDLTHSFKTHTHTHTHTHTKPQTTTQIDIFIYIATFRLGSLTSSGAILLLKP